MAQRSCTPEQLQLLHKQQRIKQLLREQTAGEQLRLAVQKVGTVTTQNALGILNVVCQQTKVDLAEHSGVGGIVLIYESNLRRCKGHGQGPKKKAKQEAAQQLIQKLCKQLGCAPPQQSAAEPSPETLD